MHPSISIIQPGFSLLTIGKDVTYHGKEYLPRIVIVIELVMYAPRNDPTTLGTSLGVYGAASPGGRLAAATHDAFHV